MSPSFPMPSGVRSAGRLLSAVLLLASGGCLYSFTGGGLPSHVRTIAILEFENMTAYGGLISSDLQQAMQQRIPRDLGVRVVAESNADAVIRGRITGYDERPEAVTAAGDRPLTVAQQRIDITLEVEIFDQREDRPIWRGSSVTAAGYYTPGQQDARLAREEAIRKLVVRIVDGAQSQW
jgi:hypothetical protein